MNLSRIITNDVHYFIPVGRPRDLKVNRINEVSWLRNLRAVYLTHWIFAFNDSLAVKGSARPRQ